MKPDDTSGVAPQGDDAAEEQDAALLAALAGAYAMDEAAGSSPQIERIAEKIRRKLENAGDDKTP